MESFVAVLHIVVALVMICLVLLQDSKGGSMGGAFGGGGGGSSVFGPLGASTLAQKLTRWIAVAFAATCIYLTVISSRHNRTVIDSLPPAASSATPANPVAPATPTPAK